MQLPDDGHSNSVDESQPEYRKYVLMSLIVSLIYQHMQYFANYCYHLHKYSTLAGIVVSFHVDGNIKLFIYLSTHLFQLYK